MGADQHEAYAALARARALLGDELVAYALATEPAQLTALASGTGSLAPDQRRRVEVLAELADTLIAEAGTRGARSWMLGANAHLDEASPASALRDGFDPERVLRAARAFAEGSFA